MLMNVRVPAKEVLARLLTNSELWRSLVGHAAHFDGEGECTVTDVVLRMSPVDGVKGDGHLIHLRSKSDTFRVNFVAIRSGVLTHFEIPASLAAEFKALSKRRSDALRARQAEQQRLEEERAAKERRLAEEAAKQQWERYQAECPEVQTTPSVVLFKHFYHIVHRVNLQSILQRGILSNEGIHKDKVTYQDISDPDVQRWRTSIEPVYERPIHSYVPLYVNPRNPMLYKRLQTYRSDLVVLRISNRVVKERECVFTDGNAASGATKFGKDWTIYRDSLEVLSKGDWTPPDAKRRICAEVLVYPSIAPNYIDAVIVSSLTAPFGELGPIKLLDDRLFFR